MHVLGTPPAFILSQDQTLIFKLLSSLSFAWLVRFYQLLGLAFVLSSDKPLEILGSLFKILFRNFRVVLLLIIKILFVHLFFYIEETHPELSFLCANLLCVSKIYTIMLSTLVQHVFLVFFKISCSTINRKYILNYVTIRIVKLSQNHGTGDLGLKLLRLLDGSGHSPSPPSVRTSFAP